MILSFNMFFPACYLGGGSSLYFQCLVFNSVILAAAVLLSSSRSVNSLNFCLFSSIAVSHCLKSFGSWGCVPAAFVLCKAGLVMKIFGCEKEL